MICPMVPQFLFCKHWVPCSNELYSISCYQVDWDELGEKLKKLEADCKASWDFLRAIAKHDSNSSMKTK